MVILKHLLLIILFTSCKDNKTEQYDNKKHDHMDKPGETTTSQSLIKGMAG